MKKKAKISFLVPTLGKRHKEIRRLFESLASQKYKDFEVVLVVQDDFDAVNTICQEYDELIAIKIILCDQKGLSKARNKGLAFCDGDIVVLSDDDCWYPVDAAEAIVKVFEKDDIAVLLTRIFDYDNKREYKSYAQDEQIIKSSFHLLSRSSIEIAYKRTAGKELRFDELFGLGAHFVCCEEVDFLIKLFRNKSTIKYKPIITVYHEKKYSGSTTNQVVAKGALYSKHYNRLIGILICLKDLLINGEKNFKPFFEGFNEYKIYKRSN